MEQNRRERVGDFAKKHLLDKPFLLVDARVKDNTSRARLIDPLPDGVERVEHHLQITSAVVVARRIDTYDRVRPSGTINMLTGVASAVPRLYDKKGNITKEGASHIQDTNLERIICVSFPRET